MNDEHTIDLEEVILGEDGVYRWMYRMNMDENKSMLYLLLKIFGYISLGGLVMWFLMLALKGVSGMNVPKILGVWLLVTLAVEFLVWLGFQISRKAMKDIYILRFEMDEKKISIYQSQRNMEQRKSGYRGRKPFRDVVSEATFSSVLNITVHRKWDLIDMAVIGGGFQVYVWDEDFDLVLNHILAHVPERVRNNCK